MASVTRKSAVPVASCARGPGARWSTGDALEKSADPAEVVEKRYKAHGKALCAFSYKPRAVLSGPDPSGVQWTRRAASHPTRFAAKLFLLFLDAAFAEQLGDECRYFLDVAPRVKGRAQ